MTANNKILVVDDDPNALSATVRVLRSAGYEVIEATTGQECIAASQANHPDLVLLDVMLPDIDGLEVCRQIQTMPSLAHVFVVLISASQTSSDQQSIGLESGADGYIALPISNRELLARVQALLRIKRAEDALRESEARYTRALQAVNDGIWDWHIPSGQAFFSALYYTMLGYEDGEFPATYDAWRLLVHPEDMDRVERELQKSIETGSSFNIDLRMRKKNGQWLWVCTRGRMSEVDTCGKAQRIVGVLSDITEHKRMEESLQERIKELDCLYAIADLEAQDDLEKTYQGTAEIMPRGWLHSEIACARIILDQQEFKTANFHKTAQRQASDIVLLGKPVGLVELCYLEERPIRDEGPFLKEERNLINAIAERMGRLTARKRAEAALRETEARFRLLAENIQDVFWISTPTIDQMIYVSPAFEIVWGRTCESLYRKSQSFIEAVHPEDQGRVIAALQEHAQGNWNIEYRIIRPDGSVRWILDRGFPIRNESGKLIFMCGVANDFTEQKELEVQLMQARKQDAIGQLAGGVAHDFNNILAAMMLNISCMEQNPKLDAQTQESLKELSAAAEQAAGLTRQLLMFSRKSVMAIKVLDLNDVVANLLKMLGRLIGEHIHLQYASTGELPLVEADQGMIEQVLMNLVVNARDAMPNGGRLSISLKIVPVGAEGIKGKVEVSPGTFVCLAVQDTGCGMDQATQSKIFEPFFTTKEVGKGTGLGLATVYGIAALHKGWVEVESEVGQGTTFRVYLPQRTQGISEPDQTLKRKFFRGQETILLVEDNDAVRRMSVRGLKSLGYQVLEAENGLAGLKLWEEHPGPIDLLLTDMVMPEGLTGLALAEKLKAVKPDLKVIISSGYNEDMSGQTTAELKGIQYLQKPYEIGLLSKKVRECLDGA